MKCPFCGSFDDQVLDSRPIEHTSAIKRRRKCNKCGKRYTTYERPEEVSLMVIKSDSRREHFDRKKLWEGIARACEKRPVSSETNKISGLAWTLSGAFFTIILFQDKTMVLTSFLYLAFGDAVAALVGKSYGKHKIYAGKSLEGSFACFIVCLIIGLIVLPTWKFAVLGALVATFIESIPWPLNDNFWMQIINAGILTLLSGIL